MTNRVKAAETVEGPYFGDGGPERSDIREGKEGSTFELDINLRDLATGEALSGLKVELWHCDAHGNYSGYPMNPDIQPEDVSFTRPMNDEKWLRGHQYSDDNGTVHFTTIFPGWYATRSTHIHFKVYNKDGDCVITSQVYFPEPETQEIYADAKYSRQVPQDTHNDHDIVIAVMEESVDGLWADIKKDGDKYIGTSTLNIDMSARSHPQDVPEGWVPPVGGVEHGKPVR
ncbi:MAG: hypothetical protein CMF31_00180 [Kordiimonas sp.]|nr:hypothetical protein [Kordiimonas sp.]